MEILQLESEKIINDTKYTSLGDGNFLCVTCGKKIKEIFLNPHSIQHKNQISSYHDQSKNSNGDLASNRISLSSPSSTQRDIQKKSQNPKKTLSPKHSPDPISNRVNFHSILNNTSSSNMNNRLNSNVREPPSLTISKYKCIKSRLNMLKKTKKRFNHVSAHKYFKKWKKTVNNYQKP